MVQWLKVAEGTFARSNKAAFTPASRLLAAYSRRSPILNSVKRDQRILSSGAGIPAKLFVSRRLLLGSVVLGAGAIAAWKSRKQHVDLHADSGHIQGRTGRRPLAYRGTGQRLYVIAMIVAGAVHVVRSLRGYAKRTLCCWHAGQQCNQLTQTRVSGSSQKTGKRDFRSLFATMNPSHADLINNLRKTERLTDKTAQAMLQVDRKYFLDPDNQSMLHLAYEVRHRHVQACLDLLPSE